MTAFWLGVSAVDGARVGSLALRVEEDNDVFGTGPHYEASVYLCEPHDSLEIISWCPLSEVNARTLEWIRYIAALDPELKARIESTEHQSEIEVRLAALSGKVVRELELANEEERLP